MKNEQQNRNVREGRSASAGGRTQNRHQDPANGSTQDKFKPARASENLEDLEDLDELEELDERMEFSQQGGIESVPVEAQCRYIEEMSENVAMKTGIRLSIVHRIIRCEFDIFHEWLDDDEQLEKPTSVLAKHISARTGIYLPTVLTVIDTEDEIVSLMNQQTDDEDDDDGDADWSDSQEEYAYFSLPEMVRIIHKQTGICPKMIDLIIQMEDEILAKHGIPSAYDCSEE